VKKEKVILKDGNTVIGDVFDPQTLSQLKSIFKDWLELNIKLNAINGRTLNVPDVLSEGLFCYYFDAIRTKDDAGSFDCVTKHDLKGVQVKSSSIDYDLTSFGPTSIWDELYFIDFVPNGKIDGVIHFYKIEENFDNLILNRKKNETFKDQQTQGRRPRFSIKREIIEKKSLKPIKIINLLEKEILCFKKKRKL
jgi:hypothetical protein